MRICFSIRDAQSENLLMPKHFGESAHFLLIDSETGNASSYPASDLPCRGPCRCHIPARQENAFDIVICRAIGHRELLDLKKKGIPIFLTSETSPHRALQQWRENQLPTAARSFCFKGRRTTVHQSSHCAASG